VSESGLILSFFSSQNCCNVRWTAGGDGSFLGSSFALILLIITQLDRPTDRPTRAHTVLFPSSKRERNNVPLKGRGGGRCYDAKVHERDESKSDANEAEPSSTERSGAGSYKGKKEQKQENALKQDFNNNGARINASVRFLLDF